MYAGKLIGELNITKDKRKERRTKMKRLTKIMVIVVCIGVMFLIAGVVFAQEGTGGSPTATGMDMNEVGNVLIVFLVLAVVFEVALTPIFNWSVFLAHFEGKGYKTPITVILAFVVFWGYGLDIISDLLQALGRNADITLGGQVITAFLIAGGSAGVFEIFTKLKINMDPEERMIRTEEARKIRAKTAARRPKRK